MLHTPSNAIGSVVPLYGAGVVSGGGGGGQTQDHQGPRYIVGNAAAGDGAFVCDFLDPGDGSGIAAAIAAANGTPGDIWLRPGTYNFASGATATPLTLPTNMTLRGAGKDLTILRSKTTGNQGLLICNDKTSVQSLSCVAPAAVAGSGATAVVLTKGNATLRDVSITAAVNGSGTLQTALKCDNSLNIANTTVVLDRVRLVETVAGFNINYATLTVDATPNAVALNVFAFASSIEGGLFGVASNGNSATLDLIETLVADWTLGGVYHQALGAFTGTNSRFVPGAGGGSQICVGLIAGDGSRITGCEFTGVQRSGAATTGTVGVYVPGLVGGFVKGATVNGNTFGGMLQGVALGVDGAEAQATQIAVNGNDFGGINQHGVYASNRASRCAINGNTITVNTGGAALSAPCAISLQGDHNTANSNTLKFVGNTATDSGVRIEGTNNKFVGNDLQYQSFVGIYNNALSNIVNSNTVTLTSAIVLTFPVYFDNGGALSTCVGNFVDGQLTAVSSITIKSDGNTVSDNHTHTSGTGNPGVSLQGASSVCLGNVCVGAAPGLPVVVTGLDNDVAHNKAL